MNRGRRPVKLRSSAGSAVEAEEFCSELKVGSVVFVQYAGDPGVWRKRLLLFPSTRGRWCIPAPDSDVYVEGLTCDTPGGPRQAVACAQTGDSPTLRGNLYRFDGVLNETEWTGFYSEGRDVVEYELGFEVTAKESAERINMMGELVKNGRDTGWML